MWLARLDLRNRPILIVSGIFEFPDLIQVLLFIFTVTHIDSKSCLVRDIGRGINCLLRRNMHEHHFHIGWHTSSLPIQSWHHSIVVLHFEYGTLWHPHNVAFCICYVHCWGILLVRVATPWQVLSYVLSWASKSWLLLDEAAHFTPLTCFNCLLVRPLNVTSFAKICQ